MALCDDIFIRQTGKAGRITLTRPDALNALTYEMAMAIEQALLDWQEEPAIALVLIDAEGGRAFCAGGDIQELYDTGMAGNFEYGRKFWADEYRLNAMIANYAKPCVAMMDGIVMGGGVGISAHGSHRIVSERTLFAMPECGIGLVPDVGGNLHLSRAPGRIGEYLAATGARLNAADTIHAGFADVFITADKLPELARQLEQAGDPSVISEFTCEAEPGGLHTARASIDSHFSKPGPAEIIASLESDKCEWSTAAAKLMRRNCPLSVACAIEIVRRSRQLIAIEEILAQEYRFTWRSMSDGDFLEGIRAQIIDKDRSPNWQIKTLEALTNDEISAMLGTLGEHELRLSH